MAAAGDAVAAYVARGRAAFGADAAVREAILYRLIVLGESAKAALAADPGLAAALPGVEWSLVARIRDRVVHHYWGTDAEVVWATAATAVPELRRAVAAAGLRG